MEQCSSLGWVYCSEQESIGELKRFLVQTTMELEATVMAAQDEISRKDEEMIHMKNLLMVAIKERDEAQLKCQKLLVEKLCIQKQLQQMQKKSELVVEANTGSLSSSDSEDSIISEPANPQLPSDLIGKQRALPEKGKLLQAVMAAGPTLQTLLLAGPLPQWQHPPPQLSTMEIPPALQPPRRFN